jgi:hypothetical protein
LYQWYQSRVKFLKKKVKLITSESFVQPVIPRFDDHYDHWSMLMENFLRSKEYWTVVVSGVAEPATDVVLTVRNRQSLKG